MFYSKREVTCFQAVRYFSLTEKHRTRVTDNVNNSNVFSQIKAEFRLKLADKITGG